MINNFITFITKSVYYKPKKLLQQRVAPGQFVLPLSAMVAGFLDYHQFPGCSAQNKYDLVNIVVECGSVWFWQGERSISVDGAVIQRTCG